MAAKFGLGVGLATSDQLANVIKADIYIQTNWMVSGEIQNGAVAGVVENLSLLFGYRQAWVSAEMWGQLGARRTFETPDGSPARFQGLFSLGGAWLPMNGGKLMIYGEARLLTPKTGNAFQRQPPGELIAGTKFIF